MMTSSKDPNLNLESSTLPQNLQDELDRRLFYLKTLYDVSRELIGAVDINTVIKNFLLMTLGNFGVIEGFILICDMKSGGDDHQVALGIKDAHQQLLRDASRRLLKNAGPETGFLPKDDLVRFESLTPPIDCSLTFSADGEFSGILGLGPKIVDEPYSAEDKDLLETLVNNLVVSLKNARAAEALKAAYEELTILNRAKDKAISHLSHELQTPIALLKSSLGLLKKQLASSPEEKWLRIMERAERSLKRLLDLQLEVDDILQKRADRSHKMLNLLLEQCADELEVLAEEQNGAGSISEKIRNRIEEIFGSEEETTEEIYLDKFLAEKVAAIKPLFSHRQLDLSVDVQKVPAISIPPETLAKLVNGLIKNAIENTPDGGKIDVAVKNKEQEVELSVCDFGVGIVDEHCGHIFEGFYPTQDALDYMSKNPFDFNAGGKGADLLRLKIFSERYNFDLDMSSTRCAHIPHSRDICPGKISACSFCDSPMDCYHSGKTVFRVVFQAHEAKRKIGRYV